MPNFRRRTGTLLFLKRRVYSAFSVLKACLAKNVPCAITVDANDVVRRLKQGFRIVSLPSGGLEAPMDATLKLARSAMQP